MHSIGNIIIIGWGIFWLYWLISAFGSKKSANPKLKQFIGVRLLIFIVALILIHPFSGQTISLKDHDLVTNNNAVMAIGFIMFVLGLFLAVWARIFLGRNWGMPMTQKQNPELVTSGPYHYIRHPIYTGILLAVLGSVLASSIYWLIFFAFAGPYFIYSATVEEKLMTKLFPKVYPAYKSKTKMLIPFIF